MKITNKNILSSRRFYLINPASPISKKVPGHTSSSRNFDYKRYYTISLRFLILITLFTVASQTLLAIESSESLNDSEWRMYGRFFNGTRYTSSYAPPDISDTRVIINDLGTGVSSQATVVNGSVFVTTYATLHELNASNISISYNTNELGASNLRQSDPAVSGEFLYLGGGLNNIVYQLNLSNISQTIATYSAGDAVENSPVIFNGSVYIGSKDDNLYQLNASNISQLIASRNLGANLERNSVVIINDIVYITSAAKKVLMLNATNISLPSIAESGNMPHSPWHMAYYNDNIYIANMVNSQGVVQLNASNVSIEITRSPTTDSVWHGVAVGNGYVYYADYDASIESRLMQVNATNISREISNNSFDGTSDGVFYSSPAVTDRYVFVGNRNSKIYQFDANDVSSKIAEYTAGGVTDQYTSATVAGGFLYIGDSSGNLYQFGTDNPTTLLDAPIENYSTAAAENITFNCTGSDSTGVLNVSLYISDSKKLNFNFNQSANISGTHNQSNWTLELTSGIYLWSCLTFDTDGNQDFGPNRTIYVDPIAPSIPTISDPSPSDGLNTSTSTWTFNWTVTDNADETLSCNLTVEKSANVTNIGSTNNTATTTTVSGFNDSTHSWNISCTDNAGNTNTSETRSFTIDSHLPDINITSPGNTTNTTYTQVNINYSATDLNLESCWYTNDSYSGNTTLESCANITTITWKEGNHNVTIYANDTYGNENFSAITFTVDNSAPSFTDIGNISIGENKALLYDINATDIVAVDCFTVNDSANFKINCSGHLENNTSLQAGVYNLNISVTDTLGHNNSSLMSVNVTYVGAISLNVTYPNVNINATQNTLFNITANVTCLRNDCGEINVTLDYINLTQKFYDDFEDTTAWSTLSTNSDCDKKGTFGGCDSRSSDYDFYINSNEYSGVYSLLTYDWDIWQSDKGLWQNITPATDCQSNLCQDYRITFYEHNYGLDDGDFCSVWATYSNGTVVTLYNCTNGDSCDDDLTDSTPEANDYDFRTINLSSENVDLNDSIIDIHIGGKIDGSGDYCFWDEFKIEAIKHTLSPNDTLRQNVTLNVNESTVLVWWVNATGGENDTHFISVSGNRTNDLTIFNTTKTVNITITSGVNVPTLTINSPINASNISNPSVDINYSVSSNVLESCWYSNDSYLENITQVGCTNVTNITWSEGQHNVTIYANDTSGGATSASITYTIDLTYPNITIISPANQNYAATTLEFNVTISEYGRVSGSLDNGASNFSFQGDKNPYGTFFNYTNASLEEGTFNLTIYANDTAGNNNNTEIIEFTISRGGENTTFQDKFQIDNLNITTHNNISHFVNISQLVHGVFLSINNTNTSQRPYGKLFDDFSVLNFHVLDKTSNTLSDLVLTNEGYILKGLNITYDYENTGDDNFHIRHQFANFTNGTNLISYDYFTMKVNADVANKHQLKFRVYARNTTNPDIEANCDSPYRKIINTGWTDFSASIHDFEKGCNFSNVHAIGIFVNDVTNTDTDRGNILLDELVFRKNTNYFVDDFDQYLTTDSTNWENTSFGDNSSFTITNTSSYSGRQSLNISYNYSQGNLNFSVIQNNLSQTLDITVYSELGFQIKADKVHFHKLSINLFDNSSNVCESNFTNASDSAWIQLAWNVTDLSSGCNLTQITVAGLNISIANSTDNGNGYVQIDNYFFANNSSERIEFNYINESLRNNSSVQWQICINSSSINCSSLSTFNLTGYNHDSSAKYRIASGNLTTYINSTNYLQKDRFQFRRANLKEQEIMQDIISSLENNKYNAAIINASAINYTITNFTHILSSPNRTYYIVEPDDKNIGWGYYVYYPESSVNVIVSVPHPLFDSRTKRIGPQIYTNISARWLFVSSSHRNNTFNELAEPVSDDNRQHPYYSAMINVTNSSTYWLEIHGFSDSNLPSYPNVTISAGNSSLTLITGALANNTTVENITADVYNGSNYPDLAATRNVIGKYIRNISAFFIHVETSDTLRNNETTVDDFIRAVKNTFNADVFSAPAIEIVHPLNNSSHSDNLLHINYTVSDVDLDSCWYTNDSLIQNVTLNNCANITDVVWSIGQHNVTIYANDTTGKLNSSTITFSVDLNLPTHLDKWKYNSSFGIHTGNNPAARFGNWSDKYKGAENGTHYRAALYLAELNVTDLNIVMRVSGGQDHKDTILSFLQALDNNSIDINVVLDYEPNQTTNKSDHLIELENVINDSRKTKTTFYPNVIGISIDYEWLDGITASELNATVEEARNITVNNSLKFFPIWFETASRDAITAISNKTDVYPLYDGLVSSSTQIFANGSNSVFNSNIVHMLNNGFPHIGVLPVSSNSDSLKKRQAVAVKTWIVYYQALSNFESNISYALFASGNAESEDPLDIYTINSTIDTQNISGGAYLNPVDNFNNTDSVYIYGMLPEPNTTYELYLINNTSLVNQSAIPARITNSNLSIITNERRFFVTETVIQTPSLGYYDIVIDSDNDSLYDAGMDGLDSDDIAGAGFKVFNPVPSINITAPINNTNSTISALNINYTVSDNDYQSCWYSNDSYNVNITLNNCSTNITQVNWSEGQHNITIYVNDTAGNGNSSTIQFNIDTTGPDFTNLTNQTNEFGEAFTYDVDATDLSGVACFIVNDSNFKINCSGYLENNTSLNVKEYLLNITVNDTLDNPRSGEITVNVNDTAGPTVTNIDPLNDSGSRAGNISYKFNVTDASNLSNCSLIVNYGLNQTNNSSLKNTEQIFMINNASIGLYNWSVNCTDIWNNSGSSAFWSVSVFRKTIFAGRSTNLSRVNLTNVSNYLIEEPAWGIINFTDNVNLKNGADLNTNVNISYNRISINSSLLPALNKSARLVLYNLTFNNPRILRDGEECSLDICTMLSYSGGNLTFNVTQFSVYSAEENPAATPSSSSNSGGGSSRGCPFKGFKLIQGKCVKDKVITELPDQKKITPAKPVSTESDNSAVVTEQTNNLFVPIGQESPSSKSEQPKSRPAMYTFLEWLVAIILIILFLAYKSKYFSKSEFWSNSTANGTADSTPDSTPKNTPDSESTAAKLIELTLDKVTGYNNNRTKAQTDRNANKKADTINLGERNSYKNNFSSARQVKIKKPRNSGNKKIDSNVDKQNYEDNIDSTIKPTYGGRVYNFRRPKNRVKRKNAKI